MPTPTAAVKVNPLTGALIDPPVATFAAANGLVLSADAVLKSLFDSKGDILAASADNAPPRLSVGTNGQVLVADSAQATGLKWSTLSGSGTVTSVAQSFTGGLISVADSPITSAGTLALTVAGTSGGIPYFSSSSSWATSAALAANAIVIGGGAGAAPSTTTTGTGVIAAFGNNVNTASGVLVFNAGGNLVVGNYFSTGGYNGVFISNVAQNNVAGSGGGIRLSDNASSIIGVESGISAYFGADITVEAGGPIDTGGAIDTSNGLSVGGYISTAGNTSAGGNIDTSGSTTAGGNIYTNGVTAAGGSIDTSDGGGSISTRGVGSIGLGVAATRTTLVGQATSARTVTLPDATGELALVSTFAAAMCGGRATLTTATPILTASVTGGTTIYWTPCTHNIIGLYNGTKWIPRTFNELSIILNTLSASTAYDCFAYDNSGTVALETVAWTNSTTRATALAYQDGVLCKSGALTRRYLFSFILDGSKQCSVTFGTAAANGGAAQIDLWNYYNRVSCSTVVADTTDSWTYTTNTWRSSNNSNTNRVTLFIGVQQDAVSVTALGHAGNSGSAALRWVGVGIDSTSSPSGLAGVIPSIANRSSATASWGGYIGIGSHYLQWLEKSSASGTTTWYGDSTSDGLQTGITATFTY